MTIYFPGTFKPFTCNQPGCEAAYKDKTNLVIHLRNIHNIHSNGPDSKGSVIGANSARKRTDLGGGKTRDKSGISGHSTRGQEDTVAQSMREIQANDLMNQEVGSSRNLAVNSQANQIDLQHSGSQYDSGKPVVLPHAAELIQPRLMAEPHLTVHSPLTVQSPPAVQPFLPSSHPASAINQMTLLNPTGLVLMPGDIN